MVTWFKLITAAMRFAQGSTCQILHIYILQKPHPFRCNDPHFGSPITILALAFSAIHSSLKLPKGTLALLRFFFSFERKGEVFNRWTPKMSESVEGCEFQFQYRMSQKKCIGVRNFRNRKKTVYNASSNEKHCFLQIASGCSLMSHSVLCPQAVSFVL